MPPTTPESTISVSSEEIHATISTLGAELVSLRSTIVGEILWRGGGSFWSGHSPLLFPIVGRVADDAIQIEGGRYPMPIHGFARSSCFDVVTSTKESCTLTLVYSSENQRYYPFNFKLDVQYKAVGSAVEIEVRISKLGEHEMPFMFGLHPGFRWPLQGASGKGGHYIEFPEDEVLEAYSGTKGFLGAQVSPIHLASNRLMLNERLFEHGAIMFESLASRRVRFANDFSIKSIEIRFPTTQRLALWSQPGAGFICIEPWLNLPHTELTTGEFSQLPNVSKLRPGKSQSLSFGVELRG